MRPRPTALGGLVVAAVMLLGGCAAHYGLGTVDPTVDLAVHVDPNSPLKKAFRSPFDSLESQAQGR